VVSQRGPDDGNDTTGFFNTEYLCRPETKEQCAPSSPRQEKIAAAIDKTGEFRA